jgi:predicted pyridoxine 5'-phosphate oxidase superfamily flavin-nucleotide-binding protein
MDDGTGIANIVSDETALRGFYPEPMEFTVLKQLDRLDAHCRNFLAHSPFAVIGSTRPGRGTDVSPRGDAPGFARVLDDYTIAIPDRPGNNRLDTMSNIVADGEFGYCSLFRASMRRCGSMGRRGCLERLSFLPRLPSRAGRRTSSFLSRYEKPFFTAERL